MKVESAGFWVDGTEIFLHTLEAEGGISLTTTNLGAAAVSLKLSDGTDVLLGFETVAKQLEKGPMFGATLGRYAGRICGAEYIQGEYKVQLSKSHGADHAHGGYRGFDKRAFALMQAEENQIRYRYISPAGEEGYPGTLTLDVTYSLLAQGVRVEYDYVSDADTVAGISNHMYFNLLGNGEGNAARHTLELAANRFQSVNADGSPSGMLLEVKNTPMDLRRPILLCERMSQLTEGLDHDFILMQTDGVPAAILTEPISGRRMRVWTDMPCLHVYLADFGGMCYPGKNHKTYTGVCGICFEPMHLSDCLHSRLGSMPYLAAGEHRHQETTLQFDCVQE